MKRFDFKKLLSLCIVLFAAFALVSSASALTFTAQDGDIKVLKCATTTIGYTVQANTIGLVPSGAVVVKVEVGISTAFNGSSATIDIGYSGTAGALMANTAITEATAGAYVAYPAATLTANKTLLATVGGTVGTTGAATIIVWYY